MIRLLCLVLCFVSVGRALLAQHSVPAAPLLLVSVDGFRWDYTDIYAEEAPVLRTLIRDGSSVRSLVPVFPSNTFPNHYSIVTGLYPAKHGIINNDFFDPKLGEVFRFTQPSAARDPKWWRGEPIWVTAIKQGRKAATAFWVGSETVIDGIRPTFWQPFNYKIPFETRLEQLIGWLKLPPAERPAVVAFYLEETNSAGHRFGPESPEVRAAVALSDQRIGTLLTRLRAENIEPNLVVVSDHGMTATSVNRVVILEDHLARASVQIDAEGSAMALRPVQTDTATLIRAFEDVAHVRAFRAEDLPTRFHFKNNDRIAPVWLLPEEGWHVVSRATFDRLRANYTVNGYLQGDHGYDPALPSMHGILIAHGPAFRRGARHPAAENIHVYRLLCAVLGLTPAENDGDDRLAKAFLRD